MVIESDYFNNEDFQIITNFYFFLDSDIECDKYSSIREYTYKLLTKLIHEHVDSSRSNESVNNTAPQKAINSKVLTIDNLHIITMMLKKIVFYNNYPSNPIQEYVARIAPLKKIPKIKFNINNIDSFILHRKTIKCILAPICYDRGMENIKMLTYVDAFLPTVKELLILLYQPENYLNVENARKIVSALDSLIKLFKDYQEHTLYNLYNFIQLNMIGILVQIHKIFHENNNGLDLLVCFVLTIMDVVNSNDRCREENMIGGFSVWFIYIFKHDVEHSKEDPFMSVIVVNIQVYIYTVFLVVGFKMGS